jgi:long-subunit fatty acid transport protein
VPASRRLPDIPVGDVLRFALGAGHDFNEHVNISTGYTLGWMRGNKVDDVELPSGVVLNGKYETNIYHFFGLTLNVKL